MRRFLILALLAFHASLTETGQAAIVFNDGETHVVDDLVVDFIEVRNSPGGMPTTVTFEPGAAVIRRDRFDDSVFVRGESTINIQAGRYAHDVSAYNDGRLNISAGQFNDDIYAQDQATVVISGGTIEDDVEAYDSSEILMTAGSVGEDIEVLGGSMRISGGTIAANGITNLDVGLGVGDGGSIELIGSDFLLNGIPIASGEVPDLFGFLSGVLADGTPFTNVPFLRDLDFTGNLGTLTVTAVPEPSAIAFLIAGASGCWMSHRHRKRPRPGRVEPS
ncbi:MAG: hypothetical protein AAGD07_07905 [Planctomycetota bacterium]